MRANDTSTSDTTVPPVHVSRSVLLLLFFLAILAFWVLPFLMSLPRVAALFLYLAHWASIGALIGFAISKNKDRGIMWGVVIGAALSAILKI